MNGKYFTDNKGRSWHLACYWKEKTRAGLKSLYIEQIHKNEEAPGKCAGCKSGILKKGDIKKC